MIEDMNEQKKKCKSTECLRSALQTFQHILANHVPNKGTQGIGYTLVPPSINHLYRKLRDQPNVVPYISKTSRNLDLFSSDLSKLSSYVTFTNAGTYVKNKGNKIEVCDADNKIIVIFLA
ncbi:hypothetical protein R6Q59_023894 [Mikania micrantha]